MKKLKDSSGSRPSTVSRKQQHRAGLLPSGFPAFQFILREDVIEDDQQRDGGQIQTPDSPFKKNDYKVKRRSAANAATKRSKNGHSSLGPMPIYEMSIGVAATVSLEDRQHNNASPHQK